MSMKSISGRMEHYSLSTGGLYFRHQLCSQLMKTFFGVFVDMWPLYAGHFFLMKRFLGVNEKEAISNAY